MRTAILRNLLTGAEVIVHATTEHPDSHYGTPVWVDDNGFAYCDVGSVASKVLYEIIEDKRYMLQKSDNLPDGWVCTDTENNIVCVFENHKFNDTQEVTFLEDSEVDALSIAMMMREMADWLNKNHYDKVF